MLRFAVCFALLGLVAANEYCKYTKKEELKSGKIESVRSSSVQQFHAIPSNGYQLDF